MNQGSRATNAKCQQMNNVQPIDTKYESSMHFLFGFVIKLNDLQLITNIWARDRFY